MGRKSTRTNRSSAIVGAAVGLVLSAFAPAAVQAEDDVILKAMKDEMQRSLSSLHAENHPKPYFISYTVRDVSTNLFSSCLGSETDVISSRTRVLDPIVRIGDYKMDSSYPSTTYSQHLKEIAVDDDYWALRENIWQETDKQYKSAVRNYEWKKAYLQSNNVPELLDDMSKEPPLVSLSPTAPMPADEKEWRARVQELSALFKHYPLLQQSKVQLAERCENRWLVNSEGTVVKDSCTYYELVAWANAQASDGMKISDVEAFGWHDAGEQPDLDKLKATVEALGARISQLARAPLADDYCGPVLLKGQAAAEFISQVLAPNLGFAEGYVSSEELKNPLKNAIGRRIFPKSISVSDDPLARQFKGTPLLGGFKIDDDGVAARKVVLIDRGILKAFCQSRLPTKYFKNSNGHSMAGHGDHTIIELSSQEPIAQEKINDKLVELAKDAGLEYVLVVERLEDEFHLSRFPPCDTDHPYRRFDTPHYSHQPANPVLAYRLYLNDGHKELVRGFEFKDVSLRVFKDIQAVADDPQASIVEPVDYISRSVITPSLLIGEMELSVTKAEQVTPPVMQSPLAESVESKAPAK